MMRRHRGILRGILLAFVSVALTALAVEIGLRLFAPQALLHDPDAFIPDEQLGARLAPGFTDRVVTTEFSSTWVINEKGYRGAVAENPRTAPMRIVALGDSFTFGYGVGETQTWPRLLQQSLNAGRGADDRVEVVNLGVGGYGTWQESIWLERNWEELRPDLVILGFYVGNDPEDNARTVQIGNTDAGAATTAAGPSLPPRGERARRWFGSRLHLYSLVSTRADELLVRLGLRRLVYPFELELLRVTESEATRRAWTATDVSLRRLAGFCRTTGTRLVVALIPMKHQVSDTVWARLLRFYPSDAGTVDRFRPQRIVKTLCAEENVETVDVLEGLAESSARTGEDGRVYYWPRDQHFNQRGHVRTAELLAEYLRPR